MEKMEAVLESTIDIPITEKLRVYLEVIDLFTAFTDPKVQRQVAKSSQKQEALGRQIAKIGMRLALLGADDVVKKYVEFRNLAQQGGKSKDIVYCFGDLILKMRTDLHGATGKLYTNDILGAFIVGNF